jgi:hypothetical protein
VALADFARAWTLARKLEDLLGLQTEVRQSFELMDQRLRTLEDRLLHLETEQTQIITEARSAATVASTMVAGSNRHRRRHAHHSPGRAHRAARAGAVAAGIMFW